MKIRTFTKHLNATELGLGNTNDTYIAIPNEVDLSGMFTNRQAITVTDRVSGEMFTPPSSNIMYVQTGQNGQERISGLGEYFRKVRARVGDEIIIERIDKDNSTEYFLDFVPRDVIVLQKAKPYVEIIRHGSLQQYKVDDNFILNVVYKGKHKKLKIAYMGPYKKKKSSPKETDFYDLQIDGKSLMNEFSYQEYIEIDFNSMHLSKMVTYEDHSFEWED